MPQLVVISQDVTLIEQVQQLTDYEILIAQDVAQLDAIRERIWHNHVVFLLDIETSSEVFALFQEFDWLQKHWERNIVVIDTPHQQTQLEEYLDVGATDYLFKPLHLALLKRRIETLTTLEANSEYMGYIGHELLHYMTGIDGWSGILSGKSLKPDVIIPEDVKRHGLEYIYKITKRVIFMIQVLRDKASLEFRDSELRIERVQLPVLLNDFLEEYKRLGYTDIVEVQLKAENADDFYLDIEVDRLVPALIYVINCFSIQGQTPKTVLVRILHDTDTGQSIVSFSGVLAWASKQHLEEDIIFVYALNIIQLCGGTVEFQDLLDKRIRLNITLPANEVDSGLTK